MMYPFLQLDDQTEIVHSHMLENDTVRVYVEKPVEGGFHSASCYLPDYRWEDIDGFSDSEIHTYHEVIESTAHLILRFAREGGFDNAANI